jgi:hypothetical protein
MRRLPSYTTGLDYYAFGVTGEPGGYLRARYCISDDVPNITRTWLTTLASIMNDWSSFEAGYLEVKLHV